MSAHPPPPKEHFEGDEGQRSATFVCNQRVYSFPINTGFHENQTKGHERQTRQIPLQLPGRKEAPSLPPLQALYRFF